MAALHTQNIIGHFVHLSIVNNCFIHVVFAILDENQVLVIICLKMSSAIFYNMHFDLISFYWLPSHYIDLCTP